MVFWLTLRHARRVEVRGARRSLGHTLKEVFRQHFGGSSAFDRERRLQAAKDRLDLDLAYLSRIADYKDHEEVFEAAARYTTTKLGKEGRTAILAALDALGEAYPEGWRGESE